MAKQKIDYLNGTAWLYFGVLDSFRLDGIELRDIPVEWPETDQASPGGPSDGIIGTWVFSHFLTTFDYAGRSPSPGGSTRRARSSTASTSRTPSPATAPA